MRHWGFILLGIMLGLAACQSARVLTPVELKEQELADLNASVIANGKELEALRAKQLLRPRGSPGYLAVGREVALLVERSANLALEFEGKKMELAEARRAAAEAAAAATNAVPSTAGVATNGTATATNTAPVVAQGGLALYAFGLVEDVDQGTKAVAGELENTTADAMTDVSVVFKLLDSDGQDVGTVSDQTASLEPGVRWAFKALVLDNAAVKAELIEFKVDGNSIPAPPPPTTTPPPPGESGGAP